MNISSKSFLVLSLSVVLASCSVAEAPDDTNTDGTMPAKTSMTDYSRAEWLAYYEASPAYDMPCDQTIPEGVDGVSVYEVGDNHYVVQLLCGVHAYQNSYLFYNLNVGPNGEQTPIEMSFDRFTDVGRSNTSVLIGASFDPATKTLTTLEKARGAGDCGGAATYEWREDIGGFFELTEFRQKTECDGEAGEWPVIFSQTEQNPAEGHMDDAMMEGQ